MPWGSKKARTQSSTGEWFVTGAPAAGTEDAVAAIEQGLASSAAALRTVDPAFDGAAFVAWSGTVYARATAAWMTRDPEPLRAVMDAAVWDSYAKHLLFISTLPMMQSLMAAARATPLLTGTSAGAGHHSALVTYAVEADPSAAHQWHLSGDHRPWKERWLFQRPDTFRTHRSGAVAVCPVCGAPAEPEETGRCKYCHSETATRTAGWLVTRTETTLAQMAKMDDKAAQVRADMNTHIPLPPPPVVPPPSQPPRAGP